ncbi:hypothetical protein Tco_0561648 [Tanacetum coccineum]
MECQSLSSKTEIAYLHPISGSRSRRLWRPELLQQLSKVHSTFHVSNLKKCLSDESLVIPLEEIQIDDKLHFVEEPVEIMGREVKRLKQSRIPIIKVRWNSRRGPELCGSVKTNFIAKIHTSSPTPLCLDKGVSLRIIGELVVGEQRLGARLYSERDAASRQRSEGNKVTSPNPNLEIIWDWITVLMVPAVFHCSAGIFHLEMDNPCTAMNEYVQLETKKALRHGQVYNWEAAKYGKISWYLNTVDTNILRFFETKFPTIVYDDALKLESDFSSKHTLDYELFDNVKY